MNSSTQKNSEKFRILQLTSSSDIGGTERMLIKFLEKADRDKFDFTVYSMLGSGILTRECEKMGIPAKTFGINSMFDIPGCMKAGAIINSGNFHLIHSFGLRADLLSKIFTKTHKDNSPLRVSGIRSIDPHRNKLHIFLDRFTAKNTDLWISNSEAGRQVRIRREKFPADKIITIHNGIPVIRKYAAGQKSEIRKQLGISESDILVAHISNLRSMKGHEDVLAAAASLIKRFPQIKFIFPGRDDSGGKIPGLANQLGVSSHVTFPGFVNDPEKILCAADIFILPSHWEGLPTSILEAMLYSLPVIATDVGGISEMIKHDTNGLLIPPHSPESIESAISKVISDKNFAAAIGANAQKTVTDNFRVEIMTEKIQNAYLELLKS